MKSAKSILVVALFVTTACVQARTTSPAPIAPAVSTARFADEVALFEASDKTNPPPRNAVLFVGSSTIRRWQNLSADFPGVTVIQRGVGGSQAEEILHYTPRIVLPYKPRLIVFYAGDNDLQEGRTPEMVVQSFKDFVALVHRELPDTKIAFVSIKPSLSRIALIDKMRSANATIRNYIATDPKLIYVDVFNPMLGEDGMPLKNIFVEDGLHMNAAGYAIWRAVLQPVVNRAP